MDRRAVVAAAAGVAVAAAAFAVQRFRCRSRPKEIKWTPIPGVLTKGRVAVITGAGSGIGLATALRCAERGMRVVLVDIDKNDLQVAEEACVAMAGSKDVVLARAVDVGSYDQMMALKDEVYGRFGEVGFLFNNAGIGGGGGPFEKMDRWREVVQVNLWGVVNGVQAFVPSMVAQGTPCVVVNTGSKQGITTPPGDTAYNVSKAGVKVLTEGLQHKLRSDGSKCSAFLLIPGWVNTSIVLKQMRRTEGADFEIGKVPFHEGKPAAGAWMPSQVVDVLFQSIESGGPFYIICPDHEMSNAKFLKAVQWNTDDVVQGRPPLSRWLKGYTERFADLTKGL